MTFEMIKKDKEIILTVAPTDNLEREFFNQLFSGEVKVEQLPNGETIIIKKIEKL